MMIVGVLLLIGGTIFVAYNQFISKENIPVDDNEMTGIKDVINNKYYVDEAYEKAVTKPLNYVSSFAEKFLNNQFIDGIVNSMGNSLRSFGNLLREVQSGNIGNYLVSMVLAMIAILIFSLI
jgi:NADH-quinone oxidoreductase subunit L